MFSAVMRWWQSWFGSAVGTASAPVTNPEPELAPALRRRRRYGLTFGQWAAAANPPPDVLCAILAREVVSANGLGIGTDGVPALATALATAFRNGARCLIVRQTAPEQFTAQALFKTQAGECVPRSATGPTAAAALAQLDVTAPDGPSTSWLPYDVTGGSTRATCSAGDEQVVGNL